MVRPAPRPRRLDLPRARAERLADVARRRLQRLEARGALRGRANRRLGRRLGAAPPRPRARARAVLPSRNGVAGRRRRAAPGLRAPRRAEPRHEDLRGAGVGAGAALPLEASGLARPEARSARLRGPRRDGAGGAEGRDLARVPRERPPAHREGRLQHAAADGRRRAPLLRLVRLPGLELLRGVVALRRAGGAQGARRRRPRPRHRGHHGPRALARRRERGRGPRALRRHRALLPARRPARPPPGLGLGPLRLRPPRDAALPALQLPLLARRVPLRRLPLRRRHLDALLAPRARLRLHRVPAVLRRDRRRGRLRLPRAREPRDPRGPPRRDHDRGGRLGDARPRRAGARRRRGLRLPHGDGRHGGVGQAPARGA